MASTAALRRTARSFIRLCLPPIRAATSKHAPIALGSLLGLGAAGVIVATVATHRKCGVRLSSFLPRVEAATGEGDAQKTQKTRARSYRERRFRSFASSEFKGQPFMTPRDFLESLANDEPSGREGCVLDWKCVGQCGFVAAARIGARRLDDEVSGGFLG